MTRVVDHIASPSSTPSFASALHGTLRGVSTLLDAVALWSERRRERRQLMEMPDHLLRDIGITRVDAFVEADKPFWRA